MRSHHHTWRSLTIFSLAAALFLAACQGETSTASTTGSTTTGNTTSTSGIPGQPTATARPTATLTPAPTATLAPEPPPTLPTGHLLFVTNGNLYSVDISRQLLAWSDHNNHGNGYLTTPLICQGQIIAIEGYSTTSLQRLDPQTGSVMWNGGIPTSLLSSSLFAPVGCDSKHVYATSSRYLFAFDYITANKAWDVAGDNPECLVSGSTVYMTTDSTKMEAIDAATGTERWFAPSGLPSWGFLMATSATTVFTMSNGNTLNAFAANDGHALWSVTTPQAASISYADGIVFVELDSDNLLALSATDGHQLWQFATHNHDPGLPVVANGIAYLNGSDDHVYAVNEQTGAVIWELTPSGNYHLWGQPVIDGNILFYYTYNQGNIQIIGVNTGTHAVVWSYAQAGNGAQLVLGS